MIWQHAVVQCLSKEREDSCFQEAAIWIDLVGLPNCGDIFIFPNHWLCPGFTFCATWPEHTYVASNQNWKRWKSENVTQNPSDVSHFIPFPIYITDNKSWKLISHPWPLEDSSWSSASVFAGTACKGIPRPIKIRLFVVILLSSIGPKESTRLYLCLHITFFRSLTIIALERVECEAAPSITLRMVI